MEATFWDSDASKYVFDRWTGSVLARKDAAEVEDFVRAWLLPPQPGPLLDAGCGPGYWSGLLLGLGFEPVVGLDCSRQRLDLAPYKCRVLGTVEQLPFRDAVFGGVLLIHVLDYVRADIALSEIWRVLKPGGRAVVICKNPTGMPWRAAYLLSLLSKRSPHECLPVSRSLVARYWKGRITHFGYFSPRIILNLQEVNDGVRIGLPLSWQVVAQRGFGQLGLRRWLSWWQGFVLEK